MPKSPYLWAGIRQLVRESGERSPAKLYDILCVRGAAEAQALDCSMQSASRTDAPMSLAGVEQVSGTRSASEPSASPLTTTTTWSSEPGVSAECDDGVDHLDIRRRGELDSNKAIVMCSGLRIDGGALVRT